MSATRADLREALAGARERLTGLQDRTLHWSLVYDEGDLLCPDKQDVAAELAAAHVADLERELAYEGGGTS